jgi:hypothetical protein
MNSVLTLSLSVFACGAGVRMPNGVGVSPSKSPVVAASSGPTAPAVPVDQRIKALTPLTNAAVVSQGHAGGRFRAQVYGNALAKDAFAAKAGDFPAGTVFLMTHVENATDDAPGPTLMMEKKPRGTLAARGDWTYAVIDTQGAVREEGAIPGCFMCHDDAPRDRVFAF